VAEQIDLRPQELDLKLYAGDGVRFRVIAKDNSNAAVPLTGDMLAQIRKKRGADDTPEAQFTIDLADADDGIAILTLSAAEMRTLAGEKGFKGYWDLQWTPSGSEPRTLCTGRVECSLDVSR